MTLNESNSKLLSEWDYEKNNLSPSDVSTSSHKKIWWKCVKGHSWYASVANRYRKNYGCPYCSGRLPVIGVGDLFTTNPELKESWDYEKNKSLRPELLKANSERKAWWTCPQGHSWETKILNRASRGCGCPYCTGQRILEGFNDLQSQYLDIALEWDYKKNELVPSKVSGRSNKKVWWKCSVCGNSYTATIYNRTYNNSGCPKCNLRNKTSFPEQVLYFYIKQLYPDAINGYREKLLDKMELDIYIPSLKLGIEYDGIKWHSGEYAIARDNRKFNLCKKLGIKLVRIEETNEVRNNADLEIHVPSEGYNDEMFTSLFLELNVVLKNTIQPNLQRDRVTIIKQYQYAMKNNSLEVLYPNIAKEWDYDSNNGLKPSMFSPGSPEKVGWICPLGHHYFSSIASRVRLSSACPICNGKQVLIGFNDLASHNKDIASEWDYDLNGDLRPIDVTWGSGKKVWWKCPKGHPSYQSYIYSRTGKKKTGCPICSNNKVLTGVNDFATCCKELLREWDYSKNDIQPNSILPGSNYCAWWICSNGHSWKEKVGVRNRGNRGCPYCSNHRVIVGVTDLKTRFPEIADEWDYDRNGELRPEQFLPNSNKKVWWKCIKGHSWRITIAARQVNGCPYCSGRYAISGETDLKTIYPEDALDWDYSKNGDLSPENCKPKSHKKVFWKCHLCGYEWEQMICNKVKSLTSCPNCKKRRDNDELSIKRPLY